MYFPLRDRRSMRALVIVVALGLLAVLLVALSPDNPGKRDSMALEAGPVPAKTPTNMIPAASFNVSSFNLLGAGHTDGKKPQRPGWASSSQRLKWTRTILDNQKIDLVGFQEMHVSQASEWVANNKSAWGTFPGTTGRLNDAQRSVAWRSSVFDLVEAHTLDVPYFKGRIEPMPYVLLRHKATGQQVWIYNAHNPADVEGPAYKYRLEGWNRMIALTKRLRAQYPDVPVLTTGDMNDSDRFFCHVIPRSPLVSASGGSATLQSCSPPRPARIDWITGSKPNTFSNYTELRTDLIRKTTDHYVLRAQVNLPAMLPTSPIKQVLTVSVDGLRGTTVAAMIKKGGLPNLKGLRSIGASATSARTAYEATGALPNLVSMVSGRKVRRALGGHGVNSTRYTGLVHKAAGGYVSSVFDVVTNSGGTTALYSSSSATNVLKRSWDATNSRPASNGVKKSKITRYSLVGSDAKVVSTFRANATRPATYTHLHFADPGRVGTKYGFTSAKYRAALKKFDKQIGSIRRTLVSYPALKGRTMMFVMGTTGGDGKKSWLPKKLNNYVVPLFVSGLTVSSGADLYRLNPTRNRPGYKRVPYSKGAITTADLANLALSALRLPAVPGSTQNAQQALRVGTGNNG